MSKPKGFRGFRYVANPARAQRLRKRGEYIFWAESRGLWVWRPGTAKPPASIL